MSDRQTIFSPCRQYRYTLWREWPMWLMDAKPGYVQFIGLNPSTADETQDDPTIRRCIGYAKAWGYGALCMTNLFAFRAIDPKDMLAHPFPVGTDNFYWLHRIAQGAAITVAAWGTKGGKRDQADNVLNLLKGVRFHCLRKTKDGYPEHPLYLPKNLTPIPLL